VQREVHPDGLAERRVDGAVAPGAADEYQPSKIAVVRFPWSIGPEIGPRATSGSLQVTGAIRAFPLLSVR
jgi:hypothetical protein